PCQETDVRSSPRKRAQTQDSKARDPSIDAGSIHTPRKLQRARNGSLLSSVSQPVVIAMGATAMAIRMWNPPDNKQQYPRQDCN
ncbi:MAG: hypothetical protein ABGW98_16985, partial [Myxococcales bacterium]